MQMRNYLFCIFLFCIIPLINKSNEQVPIKVKQTILEQSSYYNDDNIKIKNCFLDFNELKFYEIKIENIHHINSPDPLFRFHFDKKIENDKEKLSIECNPDEKIKVKCNEIDLDELEYKSFDFDLHIAETGGMITFLLVLVGLFCLRNGYIYYNLTIVFYSAFSFILFWREFCEFLEMLGQLSTKNEVSKSVSLTVYIFAVITSSVYGYISIKIKFIKYITFGLIDGLMVGKVLFYLILTGLEKDDNLILDYFIVEIIFILAFIAFWLLFREKYIYVNMINICLISSYGMLYGIHLLIGGLPFLPFFILAKEKDDILYNTMTEKHYLLHYIIVFVGIASLGSYFNITNYTAFMAKKKKHISTY